MGGFVWRVGTGDHIAMWYDLWIGEIPNRKSVQSIDYYDNNLKVCNVLHSSEQCDLSIINTSLADDLRKRVIVVLVSPYVSTQMF